MADDLKTLREVGIAMHGVQRQFGWHTAVFAAFATGMMGAYWFMFSKIDRVEDAIARIETTVNSIAADAKQTKADVGDVKTAMADTTPPSKEEGELVAKLKDAFGTQLVPANANTVKVMSYGEVEMLAKGLSQERVKELSVPCAFAKDQPSRFSLTTLGACAAIMNAVRN
ncbi:hypothetical protein NKJ70_05835 [Mesorhizobium sp. M0092]|uniref:hypothetical protein n=1 Tax=Mesorhizobium sp. M0092 TaxID=2956876 RepID=UPI0033363F06